MSINLLSASVSVSVLQISSSVSLFWILHICFCSVTKSCPTLCDSMDCSAPGSSVLHYLSKFVQIHIHWVGDVIQPSYPLLPLSPPALNLFQHQGLSSEVTLCIRWPKYWSFSFSINPSNGCSGLISFSIDWLYLLAVLEILKSLLQHHNSKASTYMWYCIYFFLILFHCRLLQDTEYSFLYYIQRQSLFHTHV